MEFSKENVENEVYPTGHIEIENFPFQQDPRWSIESDCNDKRVHTGSEIDFRLANDFNDSISIQEGENVTDFQLRDISVDEQEKLNLLPADQRGRRIRQIIRQRYPIKVKLPAGVLYSPGRAVILESFGKIKYIQQAKIDKSAIYSNYIPQSKTVRNSKEAYKQAMKLEEFEQNSQELEEFDAPIPGPSSFNDTPRNRKRSLDFATNAPLRMSVGEKRVSLVGRRLDLDDIPEGTLPTKIVFSFFDDDFMGFSRDKKCTEYGPITPLMKSLTESVKRHENNPDMQVVNSVKVGEQFFGQGRCHIDIFKINNFYSGHTVNFSLREAPKLINAIIRSYYRGSEMTAEYHYKNDLAKVKHLEDESEREDAALMLEEATLNFNKRIRCILAAKRTFEEGLLE